MEFLKNQTVIVTGATAGFGLAIAELLASHGARLIITGRRKDRLETLAVRLQKQGREVLALVFDVRDQAEVDKYFGNLPKEFSEVDVLVNNAGLARGKEPVPHTQMQDWEEMVDTNIKGLMYCTQAILPGMVKRNRGHIIHMGSISAHYPYSGGNVYGATKAFVAQFSKNMRCELLGTDVRVTNIEPGMAETEFSLVRYHGDDARAKKIYEGMKPLEAQDIAECVLWCITRPKHVNINHIELMPVHQAAGGLANHRTG